MTWKSQKEQNIGKNEEDECDFFQRSYNYLSEHNHNTIYFIYVMVLKSTPVRVLYGQKYCLRYKVTMHFLVTYN